LLDYLFDNLDAVVFSKCFSLGNILKWCFFILKKLFLMSAHQNDMKTLKNINLKQRKK
jgi:uncharacterized membrane protein YciS (DUF1049 family)